MTTLTKREKKTQLSLLNPEGTGIKLMMKPMKMITNNFNIDFIRLKYAVILANRVRHMPHPYGIGELV